MTSQAQTSQESLQNTLMARKNRILNVRYAPARDKMIAEWTLELLGHYTPEPLPNMPPLLHEYYFKSEFARKKDRDFWNNNEVRQNKIKICDVFGKCDSLKVCNKAKHDHLKWCLKYIKDPNDQKRIYDQMKLFKVQYASYPAPEEVDFES